MGTLRESSHIAALTYNYICVVERWKLNTSPLAASSLSASHFHTRDQVKYFSSSTLMSRFGFSTCTILFFVGGEAVVVPWVL